MAESQGNGAPNPQGEGDSPKFVTEDQLNRAISARFGAFEKSFGSKLEKTLGESLAGLSTKFEEALASVKTDGAPKNEQKQQSSSVLDAPEYKGMQRELAELKKQTAEAKAERDAERGKVRDSSLRQRLGEELAKHGVDAARAKHAIGYLVDADKRVRWSEDGEQLVFRDADGEVDLATGLKGWVKTDDGKLYIPPRGAQGSGDRPGGSVNGQRQQTLQRGDIGRAILSEFAGLPLVAE